MVFEFIYKNSPWIMPTLAILVALAFAFPRWKRLYQIRSSYRKKDYDFCLNKTLLEIKKNLFPKSQTAMISYVLSCSLAINKKDIFEANLRKITSARPLHIGIKLIWETLFLLDQGNIEDAKKAYQQLCSLDDQQAQTFSKSISDVFAYYDGKIAFTKATLQKKMDNADHPALFRIYSEIKKNIQ